MKATGKLLFIVLMNLALATLTFALGFLLPVRLTHSAFADEQPELAPRIFFAATAAVIAGLSTISLLLIPGHRSRSYDSLASAVLGLGLGALMMFLCGLLSRWMIVFR